jgi:hypothetical protein
MLLLNHILFKVYNNFTILQLLNYGYELYYYLKT